MDKEKRGWIKSHRKALDNPIVCKDADHFAIWNYLLLMATHAPFKTLFGKEKITLQPGQMIIGREMISKKFKISESKVQRVLKSFEIEQQIEQISRPRKGRIITIVNWEQHQSTERIDERKVNEKWTNSERIVNGKQEYKNIRTNYIYKEQPENVDNFSRPETFLQWAKKNKIQPGETAEEHTRRWKKETGFYNQIEGEQNE